MKATDEQIAVVEKFQSDIYPNEEVLRAVVQLELVNWEGFESQRSFMVDPCRLKTALTAISDELKALREAVRKMDSAMDMQEKREIGEFHIPQHTARDIWDRARQLGQDALREKTQ